MAALLAINSFCPALGILVPRLPEFSPIQLGRAEVTVQIKQNLAGTRIMQEFYNPNARQLEADFYFPVPKGANVTDFVLYMNGKPVKGEVLEKEKAREIYEGIVRRMQDPGLVEWVDYNLFKVRVFPVPASGTQKIELEFAQPLQADQGQFRYMLPLKAHRAGAERRGAAPDVKFDVDIESDDEIRNVYSPSHSIDPDMKNPRKVHVAVPANAFGGGSGNFVLFYELSNKDIALSLLGRKAGAEDGFFSLMLSPPAKADVTSTTVSAGDYVFVVDTSGSMMDDDKITQARKALRYCIGQLRPHDRFNVLRFSTEVEKWSNGLQPATEANQDSARNWVSQLQARGGTNISGALQEALDIGRDDTNSSSGRVYTVVFITDGLPTVGITDAQRIAREINPGKSDRNGVRIFTFGVGHDVNTKLLDGLAENTRATSEYVRPGEDMEVPIARFFDKISRPAMTNLKLELPSAETYDVYPRELPDLFHGTQLTVFGRYKKAGQSAIRLTGQVGGKPVEYTYEKSLPNTDSGNEFLEKLWGTRKIAYLLDEIRKSGENREVKDEVVSLARKYGVVTPYTSYLAQEDTRELAVPAQASARVPAPMAPQVVFRSAAPERFRSDSSDRLLKAAPASATHAPAGSYEHIATQRSEMLSASTGAVAVDAAKDLRKMKEASNVTDEESMQRQASDTTFRLEGEVWLDIRLTGKEANVLKVKYLSDAYFEALRLNPQLKDAFSLGTRLRIKLSKVTLEIASEGIEKLNPEQAALLQNN
ncbi:MAG: VIT and vWA domain-containing protein [Candidatus Sumerlaeaceae bacterium]